MATVHLLAGEGVLVHPPFDGAGIHGAAGGDAAGQADAGIELAIDLAVDQVPEQPVQAGKLMETMDAINRKYGRGTLRPGRIPVEVGWAMRREMMSQNYTTNLNQVLVVR